MSDMEDAVRKFAEDSLIVQSMLDKGIDPERIALSAAALYLHTELACPDCLSDVLVSRIVDEDSGLFFPTVTVMHDGTCPMIANNGGCDCGSEH